jgi:hypothetical protein
MGANSWTLDDWQEVIHTNLIRASIRLDDAIPITIDAA